jgi:hypothetical protein
MSCDLDAANMDTFHRKNAAAALLRSASVYGNTVPTNSLNEYSAFCTIF